MDTLLDAIEIFIPGDWGNEEYSQDAPNEVICIRGADIENVKCGIYQNIPIRYVSNTSFNKKTLESGDIIIEKSGGSPTQSTGRVCYISDELIESKKNVVCSNFCGAFRMKSKWYYKYIYYYLHNIYSQGNFFNYEGKTSGIRNLLLETAFQAITLPDILTDVQKRTVKILDKIDQKINLNTRMNAELEAMAKQLYDYWFVQFDFPNENGKPYKSSGGKMAYNEELKREIPEGWEAKQLKELLVLEDNRRIPLSNKERENRKGIYPYYGATGIMDYIDDYIFDGDYILLAEDGSTSDEHGNPVVQYIWGKNWVNNHAHIIHVNDDSKLQYYYFLLKTIPVVLIETGSIQKKISQDNLLGYSVINPPSTIIKQYCNIASSCRDNQKKITDENNYLTNLRDSLLPMLMNGQVIVE